MEQGQEKGSSRCDRIPIDLIQEIHITCPEDYSLLILEALGDEFTSKDYKKASGLSMGASNIAVNILNHIGCITRIGKKGRAYLYARKKYK